MNERIKELAIQAEQELANRPKGMFSMPMIITKEKFNEKFAELILTEVISTIYRSDIGDRKQERLVDELAYKFGMKS